MDAIKFAFKKRGMTCTEKAVLLHLAWHHNELSGECNPTMKQIADETGLTQRHLQRVILSLENKKAIAVSRGKGGKRHEYTICRE